MGVFAPLTLLALAGCGSGSANDAGPTSAHTTFEDLSAANRAFVECMTAHGAVVNVTEITSDGAPDLSNTVSWPTISLTGLSEAEQSSILDRIQRDQDSCEADTVDPVRTAYLNDPANHTTRTLTLDEIWKERRLDIVRCLRAEGEVVDEDATPAELKPLVPAHMGSTEFMKCMVDVGLAQDLGDGYYELNL